MPKVLIDTQGDNGSVSKKLIADTQPVNSMTLFTFRERTNSTKLNYS